MKTLYLTITLVLIAAAQAWSCDPVSYAGCSGEQLRAIQQQQFYGRKMNPVSSDDYWRDRQYADRLRAEDRSHELEIERLRAQTRIEVAKRERRSWGRAGYTFYRPPVVIKPSPQPKPPELKGPSYPKSSPKRVSRASN